MIEKRLQDGAQGYYWRPHGRDIQKGFSIRGEALGSDYGTACDRANLLNSHLDAWRQGRNAPKDLDLQPGFGTIAWLIERYKRSRAWAKVSARSRPEYERAFRLVIGYKLTTGHVLGSVPVRALSARAVDKLYSALQTGERVDRRLRQQMFACCAWRGRGM
jgi:hypothetical protein